MSTRIERAEYFSLLLQTEINTDELLFLFQQTDNNETVLRNLIQAALEKSNTSSFR